MSNTNTLISPEVIEQFLNGRNPKQYVVSIEASYHEPFVSLIVNYPEEGKKIEKHPYKPFLWYKADIIPILYGGKKVKAMEAAKRYGVSTKKLRVSNDEGFIPDRLANGYKFLVTCDKSYNNLISFFKEGGIDVFDKQYSKNFFMFTPVEQFMIQTGIRLFKGMEDYDDLHRFQFDLETEGLSGKLNGIFQIGMRDNRGFELVLESVGQTLEEKRQSERFNISEFFRIIRIIKPDLITGFNSEGFDWPFILDRCERLGIDIDKIAIGLDNKSKLKRKPSMLKLGNEQEPYNQTYIFGHNILDIAHSVRRAQAINSDIKSWSLKYITKYSDVAKKNRVYVPGDKIHTIWSDTVNDYAFNETNGDFYKISERMPLNDGYKVVKGNFIVQRYLLDDLWETEQIDMIFNQAAFLISKLLSTTYSRSSTMGTASQWKLIMAAWSYENNLAIPATESKRDFTGGLSRLLEVGYAKNVVKLDYAALYPKTELTHDIFPNLDISGVMKGLLTYIVDTRDKFKFLTGKHKKIAKKLAEEIEKNEGIYSKERIDELKEELKKNKSLSSMYDKKQLPLKILANSWFGAYGAPYIFNWGDTNCAEETTCRGRQYLRLMVKHFCEKYGFKALVGDTDGFNFSFPDNINEIKYVAKGSHWKTIDDAGKELVGLDAVLAEFNENYMTGRMGLDIDDICNSTINFSRKNYANDIGGKIKFVGNSIKSKKMPVYIEEFLAKAIRLLLDGNGKDFITYYYEYVDKIYNYNIPLVKIASKAKIKTTLSEYKKKAFKKNKAGNPMPKQAHMELALRDNLKINLGDTLYYVNTGTSKNQGDIKSISFSKMTKKEKLEYEINNGVAPKPDYTELQINCKLISADLVESNLEIIKEIESLEKMLVTSNNSDEIENQIGALELQLITDEYNVAKYLESFTKKDKKTNLDKLTERKLFSDSQCTLISGVPEIESDQDTYEELMSMEDKEIKFWDSVNKIPNNMDEEEWESIRSDYHNRKRIERENGIITEKNQMLDIFKRLEYQELKNIDATLMIPDSLIIIANLDDSGYFVSRKWGEKLYHINSMFDYEAEAIERHNWYQTNTFDKKEDKYEAWLNYKSEQNIMSVETQVENIIKIEEKELPKVIEIVNKFEAKKLINSKDDENGDGDDEDDEYDPNKPDSGIDGYNYMLQKADFEIEVQGVVVDEIESLEDENEEDIVVKPILKRKVNPFEIELKKQEKSNLLELLKVDDLEEKNDEWNF
jgi:DNA polymerase elongation subunit (family B)